MPSSPALMRRTKEPSAALQQAQSSFTLANFPIAGMRGILAAYPQAFTPQGLLGRLASAAVCTFLAVCLVVVVSACTLLTSWGLHRLGVLSSMDASPWGNVSAGWTDRRYLCSALRLSDEWKNISEDDLLYWKSGTPCSLRLIVPLEDPELWVI